LLYQPFLFLEKAGANHKNQAVNLHKKDRRTMQRKKMFLVVCISALLTGGAHGQNFLPQKSKLIPERLEWRREAFHFPVLPGWDLSGPWKSFRGGVLPSRGPGMKGWRDPMTSAQLQGDGTVIPANRVVTHFGFFCRRELELEKTIRLPLRFRLGSLEYCNRLEGK